MNNQIFYLHFLLSDSNILYSLGNWIEGEIDYY